MKRVLGTVIALALGAPVFASANEAYIVGDISLQSGPDSEYPPILDLQAGTPVDVQGCIEGFSWCDVIVGNDRGWVPGSYVEEEYDSQPVYLIDYGPRIGVPIVSFSIGTYWDSHYHNRPFYSQRNVWVGRHFQPRPPPRPSFAHAPPIPNHGGHGPDNHGHDNHGPDNHGSDNHGHAAPGSTATQPQHTMTNNNAAPRRTAPAPQRDPRPAVSNNGNQHAPVVTTHTETVKRTTTTEHAPKPAPVRAQPAAQPKPQVQRVQPKPQQTPRAQPKEQPKAPQRKDDDHGH